MELTIRPKNFKLPTNVETQIRKRVEKLPRHLDGLQSAEVILSQEPTRLNPKRYQYVAQFTLYTRNNLIRSEVTDSELLNAVDQAMERLDRQIERFKGRWYHNRKGKPGLGKSSAEATSLAVAEPLEEVMPSTATPANGNGEQRTNGATHTASEEEEEVGGIVRVKRFAVRPMFPEEAIEQMELLGHGFYVFWNAADETMSVVYRRTDGDYGLIEPELG